MDDLVGLAGIREVHVDVGPDVGLDVGPDVSPDVGPDVDPDVGPDVGPEAHVDVTEDPVGSLEAQDMGAHLGNLEVLGGQVDTP